MTDSKFHSAIGFKRDLISNTSSPAEDQMLIINKSIDIIKHNIENRNIGSDDKRAILNIIDNIKFRIRYKDSDNIAYYISSKSIRSGIKEYKYRELYTYLT